MFFMKCGRSHIVSDTYVKRDKINVKLYEDEIETQNKQKTQTTQKDKGLVSGRKCRLF